MMIADAHLDLAYNVERGRDVTLPAAQQPIVDGEVATTGLPELRAAGVGLICATIFCSPRKYSNADEARTIALRQLAWYQRQEQDGRLRFVRGTGTLPVSIEHDLHGRGARATNKLPAILLMEGADAFRCADD